MAPPRSFKASRSKTYQPAVIEPLHPRGLRAFPPEVRRYIFRDAFVGESVHATKDWELPALVQAYKGVDKELYDEALTAFYHCGTVIMHGRFQNNKEMPYFQGGYIPDEDMLLVRNLKIIFKGFYTPGQPEKLSISPDIEFFTDSNFFEGLPNVHHLTLNFSQMLAKNIPNSSIAQGSSEPKAEFKDIVRIVTQKFRSLGKISIEFGGNPGSPYPTGGDRYHSWQPKVPRTGVREFESMDLGAIQQALGMNPKMAHITPVGDNAYILAHSFFGTHMVANLWQNLGEHINFCPETWSSVDAPSTTWFFEAEKGKELVWNEDNIQPNWRGFIPYEEKKGETIRWTERLVVRDFEGKAYFDLPPVVESQEGQ